MATFRRGIKFMLFVSSYISLLIYLAVATYYDDFTLIRDFPWTLPVLFVFISLICLPLPFLVLNTRSSARKDFEEVAEYKRRNDLVTSHLLAYVFGFLAFNFSSVEGWVGFFVFFGVVAVIQIRSDRLHVNPMLALFGYEIYEVTLNREVRLVIIDGDIKNHLMPPDNEQGEPDYKSDERYLSLAEMGNGIYLTT